MRTPLTPSVSPAGLATLPWVIAVVFLVQPHASRAQAPDIDLEDRVRLLYLSDGGGVSAGGTVSGITPDSVVVRAPQERVAIAWRDVRTLHVEVERRPWRELTFLGGLTGGVVGALGGVLDCYASIFGDPSCEVARPTAIGAGVGALVGGVVGATALRYRTWELVPLASGGGEAGASFGVRVSRSR